MTLREYIELRDDIQDLDELTIRYRLALSPHTSPIQRQPCRDLLPSILDLQIIDYDPITRVCTLIPAATATEN